MTPPPFIARWDLDKTYLRTEFDSVRDLVRTAFERPDQKRTVPGAAAVLRELGKAGGRIHILSGSPRQMRAKLEEKLRIDRVRWHELTLKPNLENALRLRLRAVREQLGYKLPELLAGHVRDQRLGEALTPEFLVGDDAEADAFVYSLYADVCAGELSLTALGDLLARGGVYEDRAEAALDAVRKGRASPVVRRILIHLDRQSPPSAFLPYGSRVVPFYNYFQAALVLAADEVLSPLALLRVGAALAVRHRFDADALARSALELARRHALPAETLDAVEATLRSHGAELPAREVLSDMLTELRATGLPAAPAPRAPSLDYAALAAEHRGGRRRRRRPSHEDDDRAGGSDGR